MKTKLFYLSIGIFILQGCALHVGMVNPKPKLDLTGNDKSLYLVIDESVKNTFVVDKYSGVKKSKVTDWHASLRNGFENGFKNYFTLTQDKENNDFILKIAKAELKFIPVSINGYHPSTGLKAEIRFSAYLFDEIKRDVTIINKGVVTSDKIIRVKGQETEVVENAIEKMYQKIEKEIFDKKK